MGWEMRKDSEIEPRMVMGMEGEEEEEEAEEEEEEEEEEILILDLKDGKENILGGDIKFTK